MNLYIGILLGMSIIAGYKAADHAGRLKARCDKSLPVDKQAYYTSIYLLVSFFLIIALLLFIAFNGN